MATCETCFQTHPDGICPHAGNTMMGGDLTNPRLAAGTEVGEYVIEAMIGEGGFGAVYRARHPVIGKPAAIKVLNPQYSANPEMVNRFLAEARAVNQIRHKNIIDIFSFGTLRDGRRFYVMELLEGMSLDEWIQRGGPMAPADAAALLGGVAKALDAAHAHSIVHRDLKPENIFLLFEDGRPVMAKLLDFGIAKLLTSSGAASQTRTGTPLGTPYFMSPEQCRGKDVDHRTDIYSFGIVAYQAMTGLLPFDGDAVIDVLVKQTSEAAKPPSEVRPGLPLAVDRAILQMLEKDPARRPQSMRVAFELLSAASGILPSFGSGPVPPVLTSPPLNTLGALAQNTASHARPKRGTNRRAMGALGALTLVGLGAVGAAMYVSSQKPMAKFQSQAPAPARAVLGTVALADIPQGAATVAETRPTPEPAVALPAPVKEALPIAPSPAASVFVRIAGAPAGADVYLGAEKVGVAGAPVQLARREGRMTLTVKAAGFRPEDVETSGLSDSLVAVTLSPLTRATPPSNPRPAPAPQKRSAKDLENPF